MRYTAYRKFEIIRMIASGKKTSEEVMREHFLSAEELDEWLRLYHNNGIKGLRATKLQLLGVRR